MAKLVFYDVDHRYTVDGQEVPSVSELTRFITREVYEDTPKLAMNNAADRGTRIHRATEALDMKQCSTARGTSSSFPEAYMNGSTP